MKRNFLLLILALAVIFTACEDKNPTPVVGDPSENEVFTGMLTENTVWVSTNIYELAGKVVVPEGITLTIEPGTIIKGRTGTGSLASALIVARGGKLIAEGTADKPIVFTTIDDNIALGEKFGTNLGFEDKERWGGVILLGRAKISAENGDTESQIEGIPAEEGYGAYGGDNDADNSGILKYVSIRHGGALIGDGNEINGLTLGGVGTGTVIENVEVFATLDDGIEFFGGSVNVKNAIVSYQGDDGLDIDQNYSGTVDNFVVIHGGSDSDEGLEIDGPEGSTYRDGLFTLKNGTLSSVGGAVPGTPADIKSIAQGTLTNLVFENYPADRAGLKIRASYSDNCSTAKTDAFTNLTIDNTLVVEGSKFDGIVEVYTSSLADDETDCTVKAEDQTAAEGIVVSDDMAAGADVTPFAAWTAAANVGAL